MSNYKKYQLEKLGCWQKAREYRKNIYQSALSFPRSAYRLQGQIVGAVSSVGHNIAKGFGRGSFKENMQFCRIARGSLFEVRDQLYASLDFGFIDQSKFDELYKENLELERNINGYIGFLKKQLLQYKG